jgi:hypothetical protein
MLINELFNPNSEPVIEGAFTNPDQPDSAVASAIIRRILLQRTDLLAKYGPDQVGQAVDDVADFVGDVDEIGSSDVSGWVRQVEQMLGNMQQGMAENNDPYKPEPYDEFASDTYGDNNPEDEPGVAEGDIGQLEKDIADAPVEPIANMEAQEKIGGRHDADDFDDMVSRLKKLAGAGPMKTVYDPNTRRYKNVPVAQQPTDKK